MAMDSLLIGKLDRFNYNLAMLHQTVEMTKPVLEGMKTAMAVQWFLGNIFMILLFSIVIALLIIHYRKMKQINQKVRIKKRYFIISSIVFILQMIAFNILPQTGMEQTKLTSEQINAKGQ